MNDHEELIESRIGIHDSNQFEVKLDYAINPKARRNRYRVEAYFFVPRSLGINGYTYSKEQFYGDIQAYIRFKTPHVALGSLLDPKNGDSPLNRLKEPLDRALRDARNSKALDTLSYELRMLGCLVRANVRDRAAQLSESLRPLRGQESTRTTALEDVRHGVDNLLADLDALVQRFRALRTTFQDPVLPLWIREVYLYVDEYLSFVIETHLTSLVEAIDRSAKVKEALHKSRAHVCATLLNERRHREGAGYLSVLKPDESHDHYIYRHGLLKKFVMSVLFLEISKEKEGRRASEVIAGFAAGVAMLIATALAIISQQTYGLNTMPFVVALVAGYILKDRMKDWLKQYFSRKMTHFLADYDVSIRDPETNRVLGHCREAFSFLDHKKVPKAVLQRRHQDNASPIEAESKPEIVMKYEKEVRLSGQKIAHDYQRLGDINDIIRFSVADFLVRTDDPTRQVRHYVPERDEVQSVKCPKLYHLNIVWVLKAQHEDEERATYERVRVILDKRGIRKIEEA